MIVTVADKYMPVSSDGEATIALDNHQSVYREKLLEHILLGELLKLSWKRGRADLEVSLPAIDRSGYDVLLEAHGIPRHVQLKSSARQAKTAKQKVHLDLSRKPSGCVVWTQFNPVTLDLGPFLFFGGAPGAPLPSMEGFRLARHTKGDKDGVKAFRPNLREVPKGQFIVLPTLETLFDALFGPAPSDPS